MSIAVKKYGDLTNGGKATADLTKEEACVSMYVHDYGVDNLSDEDKQTLYSLIAKIKDNFWR